MRIETDEIECFHAELIDRQYGYARRGLEETPWGAKDVSVKDPFGNRLTFANAISSTAHSPTSPSVVAGRMDAMRSASSRPSASMMNKTAHDFLRFDLGPVGYVRLPPLGRSVVTWASPHRSVHASGGLRCQRIERVKSSQSNRSRAVRLDQAPLEPPTMVTLRPLPKRTGPPQLAVDTRTSG